MNAPMRNSARGGAGTLPNPFLRDYFTNTAIGCCLWRPLKKVIPRHLWGCLHRFDPGAGGAHKIRRGFTAISNHSLHRFYDPGLVRIMQTHIDEINRLEQEQIDALNHELPFAQHLKN